MKIKEFTLQLFKETALKTLDTSMMDLLRIINDVMIDV